MDVGDDELDGPGALAGRHAVGEQLVGGGAAANAGGAVLEGEAGRGHGLMAR